MNGLAHMQGSGRLDAMVSTTDRQRRLLNRHDYPNGNQSVAHRLSATCLPLFAKFAERLAADRPSRQGAQLFSSNAIVAAEEALDSYA
jgi:hypothetical protein